MHTIAVDFSAIFLTIVAIVIAGLVYLILSYEYQQRTSRPSFPSREFGDYQTKASRPWEERSISGKGPIYGSVRPPEQIQDRVVTPKSIQNGKRFLLIFAVVLSCLATYTLYRFGPVIDIEKALLITWLFSMMILGMVVRVITSNHRVGKPLLDVTLDDLLYPILFSVIVFYPIWAMIEKNMNVSFSIYSAFLNGYFWRSIVADAKPDRKKKQP